MELLTTPTLDQLLLPGALSYRRHKRFGGRRAAVTGYAATDSKGQSQQSVSYTQDEREAATFQRNSLNR